MYNRDVGSNCIKSSLFDEGMDQMLKESLNPGDKVILKNFKIQFEDDKWVTTVSN